MKLIFSDTGIRNRSCHLHKEEKRGDIYKAKNVSNWVLEFQQFADDLHLRNAGDEVENLLLTYMEWVVE